MNLSVQHPSPSVKQPNTHKSMKLKSLPLTDLTVTAVVHVYAIDPTDADAGAGVEVVVYNQASYDRWQATGTADRARRCSCCGKAIRWASIVEHLPTATFHSVGKACAAKLYELNQASAAIGRASLAITQRVQAEKRERAFRAGATAETVAALDWAKTGVNRTAKDVADKIRKYGQPSDAQVAFLVGLHAKDTAYRATLTGGLVAGKQELAGVVVSTKQQVDAFHRGALTRYITKALIQLANGCKVWGTAPEGIIAGASVAFNATVELSGKDPAFGFYKRPTKWVVAA